MWKTANESFAVLSRRIAREKCATSWASSPPRVSFNFEVFSMKVDVATSTKSGTSLLSDRLLEYGAVAEWLKAAR